MRGGPSRRLHIRGNTGFHLAVCHPTVVRFVLDKSVSNSVKRSEMAKMNGTQYVAEQQTGVSVFAALGIRDVEQRMWNRGCADVHG